MWGLGLLLKAGGSLALGWLDGAAGFVYVAWALGYILLGWGGYLEAKDERVGKVLLGFTPTGLLGSLVLLGIGLGQTDHAFGPLILAGWGYAVLLALGGIGLVIYQRVSNAERQLGLWINLLETLSSKSHTLLC